MGAPLTKGVILLKGGILTKVDILLNEKDYHGKFHRRDLFLSVLNNLDLTDESLGDMYINILKSSNFEVNGEKLISDVIEEDFLRNWFESDFGVESVARELIQGTIRTIERAQDKNLPIDSYWLFGASGIDKFSVVIAESAYQVTRVILSPS